MEKKHQHFLIMDQNLPMTSNSIPSNSRDVRVMTVEFKVGVLLDVKHMETKGEIRLRYSEIESWIPFRYTILKDKTSSQNVDFFYCHRCFLFFDAVRSLHTLEGEHRHCCLDCGQGTVLSACFWKAKLPSPREEMAQVLKSVLRCEDGRKLKVKEDLLYEDVKEEEKSKTKEEEPWFTYDTSDDWVLSFWCECGLFNSGHHPPKKLRNEQNCLCSKERPPKVIGWKCVSCEAIHSFSKSQPDTVKCRSCQTLFYFDNLSLLEFRRGFLLDYESDLFWKKKSSSESRSLVRLEFETWINLWQSRFSTCEKLREAQVKELSRIQYMDDISDLEDVEDGKLLVQFAGSLFASQLLDFTLATKIQTLWKEWRQREQEQTTHGKEQNDDNWGELYDLNPMRLLEDKSFPVYPEQNQASQQKFLKELVHLSQDPYAALHETLPYIVTFALAELSIPTDLIYLINTYFIQNPIRVIVY